MAGKKLGHEVASPAAAAAPRESSSTLAFDAVALGVEGPSGPLPATPSRMLDMLREKLSRCRIMANDSGIACELNADKTMAVYKNLPRNIRGAWVLNIPKCGCDGSDLRFIVGRTRSTWVLLYDQSPESIYENPRFMSIDLKKRDVVVLDNGKTMYLSRVSRREIDVLNGVAAVSGGKKAPAKPDTLVPDHDAVPSYSDIAGKLSASEDVLSDDLLFDMKEFADGIKFITTLQDSGGNAHYYIISGDNEQAFYLFVNNDPGPPDGSLFKTTFKYKGDTCVLYREG